MFRKVDSLFLVIGFMAVLSVSAHASPNCLKDHKPFTLTDDTIVWTMYAAPGSECIQGLRWSYMQIYSVSVSKGPTKGEIKLVGPGFRYFAASQDYDADGFTLEVVGKNRHDPGKSTIEIVIKRPVETTTVSGIAGASSAAAQTPPPPAMTLAAQQDTSVAHPMVFYHAHGAKDACGPGCSEWIAAEGEIDNGAGNRLQRLFVQLDGARLPMVFKSPGGTVTTSMALGSVIRARQLTVSVGHTIPHDCDPDPMGENSCAARAAVGQPIEAELDPLTAMCNSACVYALAGGAVRLIPPWVTLGIHDMGFDPSQRDLHSAQALNSWEQITKAALYNYMRSKGIDEQLLYKAFAIPNASLARLSRDDAARFGMDRREFAETTWRFIDRSGPAIRKDFFVRSGGEAPHYVNGLVDLSCGNRPSAQYVLMFGRERLASDPPTSAAQSAVGIRLDDKQFALSRQEHPRLYLRSTQLGLAALDGVAEGSRMVLSGAEFEREEGPAGDITLAMDGFPAAYAKLQKACAQAIYPAPAAPLADQ